MSGDRRCESARLIERIRSIGDPFAILGIDADSEAPEIAAAYAHLSEQTRSKERRRLLQTAYELLADSSARRKIRLLLPIPLGDPREVTALVRRRPSYLGPRRWLSLLAQRETRSRRRP